MASVSSVQHADERANNSEVIFSVLIPMFNEAEMILPLFTRLFDVLVNLRERAEIVIVDDGSSDETWNLLQSLPNGDVEFQFIRLSRNFGKEAAMSAGLEHCKGKAVIVIDADLQDPPELIPQMISAWYEGFDLVNMQRINRKGETWLKRFTSSCFYWMINRIADQTIPENVGDFRLMSRSVIDAINKLPERNRFMKGIFNWPGFKKTTLFFERDARFSGRSKWNYGQLVSLAMDGITSLSFKPLRLSTWGGVLIFIFALCYGFWAGFNGLVLEQTATGFSAFLLVQLILASIQLLALGLIGEYLGRVFVEVKQRPLYCIEETKHYNNIPDNEEKD